jgi:DNA-binding NtrC family response regulator
MPDPCPEPAKAVKPRVWVIDDDRVVAEILRKVLAGQFEVVVAYEPRAALGQLQAGAPCDAVLCDRWMQGLDGVALHDALVRDRPQLAGRFVLISGDDGDVPGWHGLRLHKPFGVSEVRTLVGRLCRDD